MSTFQRAREALGIRLRELRKDARLTGRQLAERTGWQPSKVSKIENGKQTPADSDLEAWARICGRPELISQLVATLRTLETHYVDYRRMFRSGMTARQLAWADLEEQAATTRNFENVVVPGLLQTPEYARYRLMEGVTASGSPDDLDLAVAARMQRQQILYRRDKTFHFVVTESALRVRLCPIDVMIGQLDRLVALSTMSTLQFGIVPWDQRVAMAPLHGFWIFDDRVVVVESLTAEMRITQAAEIDRYRRTFHALAQAAHHGSQARAILARVSARWMTLAGG